MKKDAVAKLDALTGLQLKAAVGSIFVELLGSERSCGEQSVSTDAPTGGMAKAGRVIEDGDAEKFVADGPIVLCLLYTSDAADE